MLQRSPGRDRWFVQQANDSISSLLRVQPLHTGHWLFQIKNKWTSHKSIASSLHCELNVFKQNDGGQQQLHPYISTISVVKEVGPLSCVDMKEECPQQIWGLMHMGDHNKYPQETWVRADSWAEPSKLTALTTELAFLLFPEAMGTIAFLSTNFLSQPFFTSILWCPHENDTICRPWVLSYSQKCTHTSAVFQSYFKSTPLWFTWQLSWCQFPDSSNEPWSWGVAPHSSGAAVHPVGIKPAWPCTLPGRRKGQNYSQRLSATQCLQAWEDFPGWRWGVEHRTFSFCQTCQNKVLLEQTSRLPQVGFPPCNLNTSDCGNNSPPCDSSGKTHIDLMITLHINWFYYYFFYYLLIQVNIKGAPFIQRTEHCRYADQKWMWSESQRSFQNVHSAWINVPQPNFTLAFPNFHVLDFTVSLTNVPLMQLSLCKFSGF